MSWRSAKLAEQAELLATSFRDAAKRHKGDEAGFRSEAEAALERAANALGVAKLEKELEKTLLTGRADAVFNRLVIEWEPPGAMSAKARHPGNIHAVAQVRSYVDGIAAGELREVARLAGVACDGNFIVFARYRGGRWVVDEPARFNKRSAADFLEALLASQSGRALTADNLLADFAGEGALAHRLTKALLDQLEAELGQRPRALPARLFAQWERFFAVATGVTGEARALNPQARRALAELLETKPDRIDPARALFSLQTYFALVTKLIATLSLALFVDETQWSLDELAEGDDGELLRAMARLHRGEPFRRVGLANVIEPDVFGWFLEDWRGAVSRGVREVVERLRAYDPATLGVSPEEARDLLKDLYQGLLPRSVRHALGQYFTPDWLADQLMTRVGYEGEPGERILDPACGTGTFLVMAIGRLKERMREDDVPDEDALRRVLDGIAGFDIDPLAVVAARANYVLALGPLLNAAGSQDLDLPVYLADSIVSPRLKELAVGDRLVLETAAGKFALPPRVDTAEELREVCDLASTGLDENWTRERYMANAGDACDADEGEVEILGAFFDACRELHTEEVDGIWTRVLRNAFMPAFLEPFDLVVGNPPWVNWEHLPASYRKRTSPFWREAGLFVHKGMAAMLGAGKKDVAMLMSYLVSERLLKPGGALGFVVPETLFKTAGAGQGFRRFHFGDSGPRFGVVQVDDMVDLNPFSGATNRTALMVWRRDKPTRYPVRYTVWQRLERRGIERHATAEEVDSQTRRLKLAAAPVRNDDPTSAWLAAPAELVAPLRKLAETGQPAYEAHAGVYAGLNGVYWLAVDGNLDKEGLLPVHNLHDIGRSTVRREYGRVEAELVHPMIRGSDLQRWSVEPSAHILFLQDPVEKQGISEVEMNKRFPGALDFIGRFEKELRGRRGLRSLLDERSTAPFWSMFGVGDYTLSAHKVVWKDQAADFAAAVLSGGGASRSRSQTTR